MKNAEKKGLYILLSLMILNLVYSCNENREPITPNNTATYTQGPRPFEYGVFIVNEGNFQAGNASITHYNPWKKEVSKNIFSGINKRPLGDVAQSMIIYKGTAYVMVDNSDKIEVVEASTFKSLGKITGMKSPRFMQVVAENKTYVSSIYGENIYVVDLNQKSVLKEIPLPGWTEQMVLTDKYKELYIANMDSARIHVLNTNADTVFHEIQTGIEPNSMVLDKNQNLWILCSGGFEKELPRLIHFDTGDSLHIKREIFFSDIKDSPSNLNINKNGDTLYFLNKGVFRMSIQDTLLPVTNFIAGTGKVFYSLGVSPENEIFIGDAKDYTQAGQIYVHSSSTGIVKTEFSAGIIPGRFVFYY